MIRRKRANRLHTAPLEPDAVVSAAAVFDADLPGWRLCDSALRELALAMPGHSEPAALVKSAAVNALYGTRVLAVARAARHVSSVMLSPGASCRGVELVEELAFVPGLRGRLRSFASKYAHFFIDAERFPIYDSVAREMVRLHDGGREIATYPEYAERFESLFRRLGLAGSRRQLDRYLWLAGLGRQLAGGGASPVNAEVTDYFRRNPQPSFMPDAVGRGV